MEDKEFYLRLELACFNRVGELKKELNCSLLLWKEYILEVSRHLFFLSDKTTYTTFYSHIVFCKESGSKEKYNDLRAGKGKYGIYFFYRKIDNSVIVDYIGISAKKPRLNKRMAQHFSSTDTGGLPYKLAVRDVAMIDDALMPDGLMNLLINQRAKEYVAKLARDKIFLSYIPSDFATEDIKSLEKFLIKLLQPKYNTQLK